MKGLAAHAHAEGIRCRSPWAQQGSSAYMHHAPLFSPLQASGRWHSGLQLFMWRQLHPLSQHPTVMRHHSPSRKAAPVLD